MRLSAAGTLRRRPRGPDERLAPVARPGRVSLRRRSDGRSGAARDRAHDSRLARSRWPAVPSARTGAHAAAGGIARLEPDTTTIRRPALHIGARAGSRRFLARTDELRKAAVE